MPTPSGGSLLERFKKRCPVTFGDPSQGAKALWPCVLPLAKLTFWRLYLFNHENYMAIENYLGKVVSMSAEARERSAADMWRFRAGRPLLGRIGRTGLGAVLQSERIRNLAISQTARMLGNSTVLGHGREQIVMKDGDYGVVKLLIHTINQDGSSVEAAAHKLQDQANLCHEYLDDYWLQTTFEAAQLTRNRSAIVARQRILDNPKLYPSAVAIEPTIETRDLAYRISNLHSVSGLYPDILGANNIAREYDDTKLCFVDTIPVSPESQSIVSQGEVLTNGELIRDHLVRWEEF